MVSKAMIVRAKAIATHASLAGRKVSSDLLITIRLVVRFEQLVNKFAATFRPH